MSQESIDTMKTPSKPSATSDTAQTRTSWDNSFIPPKFKTRDEARFISVKKDTLIFAEGAPRDIAYLIESGHIYIFEEKNSPDEPVCRLGPGELFGEMALIEQGARTASAVCATDVTLLAISPEMLHERITQMDPIVNLLISLLLERYRVARIDFAHGTDNQSREAILSKCQPYPPMPEKTTEQISSGMHHIIQSPAEALSELKIEQELRQAVDEKQLIPVLQPIFRLRDKQIAGFEALIRWNHPTKGTISPGDFIPVAEKTGVIKAMDQLMLDYVADITPKVNEAAGDRNGDIYVGVNLSGVNFENMSVVENVANICAREDVLPHQIRLEITESAFISEPDMAESVLSALKSLGVSIALDDFGTGFSSLNYLHKFSIDTLKIDRTFVQQLHTQSKSLDIVRAIVGLAQTFRMSVVAEGIENDDEILALAGVGCEYGQGFLYCKPISVENALKMVKEKCNP